MQFRLTQQYGPLQQGLALNVDPGYHALVGANNVGKSALLQWMFVEAGGQHGWDSVCLLSPDRQFVQQTAETGGRQLSGYNQELVGNHDLRNRPIHYDGPRGPNPSELPRLFLTHDDYMTQLAKLNEFLEQLGVPTMRIRAGQVVHFEDVAVHMQGTGLRCALGILAALTDPRIGFIFIDEPELSLEPRLQRAMRDILGREAGSARTIVAATHSHLFLNRNDYTRNFRMVRLDDGTLSVDPVDSADQLYEIVFSLLGNDTRDLFFPGTYLVVEGVSDQIIVEKVVQLLEIDLGTIKVLSASGTTRVERILQAVLDSLIPVIMRDSPYADRVVVLIDTPSTDQSEIADRLSSRLNDRLVILNASSLEEYLPEELYERAGRDKAADRERLAQLGWRERMSLKVQIAKEIAATLERDDLARIPHIEAAVERCLTAIQEH